MKLSKEKLDEFIREELDANSTVEEVVNKLDEIVESLDEDLDRLKNVIDTTHGTQHHEISEKVSTFYYKLLERSADLNFYVGDLKSKHDMFD